MERIDSHQLIEKSDEELRGLIWAVSVEMAVLMPQSDAYYQAEFNLRILRSALAQKPRGRVRSR